MSKKAREMTIASTVAIIFALSSRYSEVFMAFSFTAGTLRGFHNDRIAYRRREPPRVVSTSAPGFS
jgi:hypothetical protein